MNRAVVKLITINGNDDLLLSASTYDYARRPLSGVRFFILVEDVAAISKEWYEECRHKYHVTVGCVCDKEVTDWRLADLLSGAGLTRQQWDAGTPEARAEVLIQGGYKAVFWQDGGNARTSMIDKGRGTLNAIGNDAELFYKYMEEPQTRIGATGYDTIQGVFGAENMTMKQVIEAEVRRQQEGL